MQRTVLIQSLSVRLSVKRVDCDRTKKNLCPHSYINNNLTIICDNFETVRHRMSVTKPIDH